MGMSRRARQSRSVPAYWMPSPVKSWRAKRGKPAAVTERRNVLPAMAEASLDGGG
jgi:hypothetical protein